jgi:hypothetical protein
VDQGGFEKNDADLDDQRPQGAMQPGLVRAPIAEHRRQQQKQPEHE